MRRALMHLPDIAAQETLDPPPLSSVYVPQGHQQALSLDSTIVVGMRGAGKSLWTAVLAADPHRRFVASVIKSPGLQNALVRVGFGLDDSNRWFPSAEVLRSILAAGVEPASIWRSVILNHALTALGEATGTPSDWLGRARFFHEKPQEGDHQLAECDRRLFEQGKVLLVLFDALDRLASEWDTVRTLLKGALRLGLNVRTNRAIRVKFFLRPDMEEDAEIWKFPDSSKLRHSRVELAWRSADLYALVLTALVNDTVSGRTLRKQLRAVERDGVYAVPRSLIADDRNLRTVIETITGPWMGRDRKRGFAYTWIPTHLADAAGRVSPRSFLLAFKHAAEETEVLRPQHEFALHYEAIQLGVAEASRIRIAEIKEDYPWVEPLLEAARGLSVPCAPRDLIQRWTPKEIRDLRAAARKLPPRRFSSDARRAGDPLALIDDLVELAVLYRTDDGRINIPDIFRVGFGIRRKGGVKPPR